MSVTAKAIAEQTSIPKLREMQNLAEFYAWEASHENRKRGITLWTNRANACEARISELITQKLKEVVPA